MVLKMAKKLLQLLSLTVNYISSGFLMTLQRLTSPSTISNKTPIGDTLYIYTLYSLSVMQALEGEKTDNPLVVSLLEK